MYTCLQEFGLARHGCQAEDGGCQDQSETESSLTQISYEAFFEEGTGINQGDNPKRAWGSHWQKLNDKSDKVVAAEVAGKARSVAAAKTSRKEDDIEWGSVPTTKDMETSPLKFGSTDGDASSTCGADTGASSHDALPPTVEPKAVENVENPSSSTFQDTLGPGDARTAPETNVEETSVNNIGMAVSEEPQTVSGEHASQPKEEPVCGQPVHNQMGSGLDVDDGNDKSEPPALPDEPMNDVTNQPVTPVTTFDQQRNESMSILQDMFGWPSKDISLVASVACSTCVDHPFLDNLIKNKGSFTISTSFSGIDTPATAFAMLYLGALNLRKRPVTESELAKLRSHNLWGIEWSSSSQKELLRHPFGPQCLFSDINGFLADSTLSKMPSLLESRRLIDVFLHAIKSGHAASHLRPACSCLRHGKACSVIWLSLNVTKWGVPKYKVSWGWV